jgi:hypothetical protein
VRNKVQKAPRSEVSASLRDLNSGSNRLPWTRVILSVTSASGQRAVIIGPCVACSRDANGCSGHGIHDRTIAVKRVAKRLATGSGGGRASGIARPRKASSSDVNNRSAIESGCVSGKRRQLTRNRRARASALPRSLKIFRGNRAIGRVAMSFSPFPMNIRANDFAAWRAAWRYVASWIGKRVTGRGVGACVVSV